MFSELADRKILRRFSSSVPFDAVILAIIALTSSSPTLTVGSTLRRSSRLQASSPLICCLIDCGPEPLPRRNASNSAGVFLKF